MTFTSPLLTTHIAFATFISLYSVALHDIVKSFTLESVVLEIELKRRKVIEAGLYRPLKSLVSTHQQQREEEVSHLCNWTSLQS